MENFMRTNRFFQLWVTSFFMLFLLACTILAEPRRIPTPMPPSPTSTPVPLSAQVTLVSQELNETNQMPPFTLKAQTPQLVGSDDPRVLAFNQRLNQLVSTQVDSWRQSFLQITAPNVGNGSSLDVAYKQTAQINDLWSLKFDIRFYSDGAAHPGLDILTINYDLAQGRELALADLFLPNIDYLGVISQYCMNELSKLPGFGDPWTEGAKPTAENYQNWNITPDGLLITFEMYQVMPGAAGPQEILVPYSELRGILDPAGVLGQFTR
jgi:hypothetical protein